MKKLNELYENIPYDTEIKGIKINSKEVESGDLFVCTMGVTADRHNFIDDAVSHGASALVVSRKDIKTSIPSVYVENTNKELPFLCSKFYDHPEDKMTMIGVTGTDGKTTTSTVIHTLMGNDICGYLGSNGANCSKFNEETQNSTPDADKLYKIFKKFLDAGCKYVSFEASSEAFYRGRLNAMKFDISVLTNITEDHLNVHKTLDNYIECKCKLFSNTKKDGLCILNHDDEHFERVKRSCNGKVLTYGKGIDNDLQIISYVLKPRFTKIKIKYKNKEYDIESSLLGEYNVYNLAAALLVCLELGCNIKDLQKKTQKLEVDGRFKILNTETPYTVVVDYAHTTNAVKSVLDFVHTLDVNRSIVVIGSAGGREKEKRPLMGKTVADNANYAIFTADDPRDEDPEVIAKEMASEIKDKESYEIEVDRKKAVRRAIDMAKPKDIVLILGKGCETSQKLKDGPVYYSDTESAYEAVEIRKLREK